MTPLPLTFVTITKDDPAGLARTLASTAALRRAGAEQVVIDGTIGDSAAFSSVVREEGVRGLRRAPDGIARAFNAGIELAGREWVWCLNGGDEVDTRTTPELLGALLAATRADIVIGGTTYRGESGPRPHPPTHLRWPPVRSWIPHPSTLVRRRLFAQFGAFDTHYAIAMDYEWWLRVVPTGVPVDVCSLPFAVFAPGGVSQRPENFATLRREQCHALRKHQGVLGRAWFSFTARAWKMWFLAQFARAPRDSTPSI